MQTSDVLQSVVLPSLKSAFEIIPHLATTENPSSAVLYGEEGALFDSINLVNFIFIVEEQISKTLKTDFKFSTEDILNTEERPFLSADNLARFLQNKIAGVK
ncbi:MAG: hypothetical protein ACXVAX_06900 [Pseudobdellovibrio sp.]